MASAPMLAILAFCGWALLAAAVVAVIAAALVRGTAPATAVPGLDDRHVVALTQRPKAA